MSDHNLLVIIAACAILVTVLMWIIGYLVYFKLVDILSELRKGKKC